MYVFAYGLQAPHDELFATHVFDYWGFSCNVIAGLTAITAATRNKNENSGVLIATNETDVEREERIVPIDEHVCEYVVHMYY